MIGDIQLRLGNTDAALEAYQQALTIDKQLVAQDAQNTGFQRGLFVSLWKLADTLESLEKYEEAKDFWQQCLEQLLLMQRNDTLQADDARFIEIVRGKLANYN